MDIILKIVLFAPPILLAITMHEVAHGWAARYLGDPTAASLGRLSLNPIKHVDPMGTIAVPAVMLTLGGVLFGWAKPVPVDMNQLRYPKVDMALVAAAGPASNLVMAAIWVIIFKIGYNMESTLGTNILLMATVGVFINSIIMILNLLPLPPLDGSKVLAGLLPENLSNYIYKLEPYGLFIVLGVFLLDFTFNIGIFQNLVIMPVYSLVIFLESLFGLNSNEIIQVLNTIAKA
ncbi:MAG: site-2 protease family protein [Pseudomonadota bacterium]